MNFALYEGIECTFSGLADICGGGGGRHAFPPRPLLLREDMVGNMMEGRLDFGMRLGESTDASGVARGRGTAFQVAAVAPSYMERRGEPSTPAELANHTCIVHDVGPDSDVWNFVTPEGPKNVRVSGGLLANDVRAVHLAALTGYGIAYLPLVELFDDLRSGTLVRVLIGFPAAGIPLSLAYPSRRHLAPRTRLVMDFIWEQVRQIQAELATASDEGAPRERRADARSLTQSHSSLPERI